MLFLGFGDRDFDFVWERRNSMGKMEGVEDIFNNIVSKLGFFGCLFLLSWWDKSKVLILCVF